jgi:hypothetical protein
LAESSEVTITLESSDADSFLFLRTGDAKSGDALHENDDVAPGTNTNSQIQETLAAVRGRRQHRHVGQRLRFRQ